MYIQGSPGEIHTPTRCGMMGRNTNAQQYSPATPGHYALISARRALKHFIVSVSYFLNRLSPKIRKLN
jgi:hypothetical protein